MVSSGGAGKYVFCYGEELEHGNKFREAWFGLYINGSQDNIGASYIYTGASDLLGNYGAYNTLTKNLSVGDYVSAYTYLNTGANSAGLVKATRSFFGGYELIGA